MSFHAAFAAGVGKSSGVGIESLTFRTEALACFDPGTPAVVATNVLPFLWRITFVCVALIATAASGAGLMAFVSVGVGMVAITGNIGAVTFTAITGAVSWTSMGSVTVATTVPSLAEMGDVNFLCAGENELTDVAVVDSMSEATVPLNGNPTMPSCCSCCAPVALTGVVCLWLPGFW